MKDKALSTTKRGVQLIHLLLGAITALPAGMNHLTNCGPSWSGRSICLRVSVGLAKLLCSRFLLSNVDPVHDEDLFQVGVDEPGPGQGQPLPNDSFARWAIGPRNLYINFSDPTILNLEDRQWDPDYVVIPKDYPEGSWIYLIIYGNASGVPARARGTIPTAHPVSLGRPSHQSMLMKLTAYADPPPRTRLRTPPTIESKLRTEQIQTTI